VATAIVGTALASAAGPVARVFAEQDPGALEWALLAYAPGVIGFGLIALLSRVLYASSHEVRAALAQTVGWLVVMGCAAVLVWALPSGWTITALGVSSTVGLSLAAVLLCVGVVRAHGAAALAGVGRSVAASALAGGVGWAVGRAVASTLQVDGVVAAVGSAAVAGSAGAVVFTATVALVDRSAMRAVLAGAGTVRERRKEKR
jgi:putative peptidoglycan lipid II flippase